MLGSDRPSRVCLALLTLAVPGALSAQDAFLDNWRALHDAQPRAVEFAIAVPKTTFYLGEVVPLTLRFTATQAKAFSADSRIHDRVGRMNYVEEYVADGHESVVDPLQGLPGGDGGMGGISGGPFRLSDKPFVIERVLNEWMRFRKPGTYRIYVLSRRVAPAKPGSKYLAIVSNILTLRVDAAPGAWLQQQLADATAILDARRAPNDPLADRLRASQVLRFLDTPASALELARRLDAGDDILSYGVHMGVLGSSHRRLILPLLEKRLIAPDQPVWNRYLDTLAQLAELVASGGPMPPFPKDEAARKARLAEAKTRTELRNRKRDQYIGQLLTALPQKQPEARAITARTLMEIASTDSVNPPWFSRIAGLLVADFHNLPAFTQRDLLEYRWNRIKSPAMLPVLRQIYTSPPELRMDPPLEDIALRRLQELEPGEARRMILAQLQKPTKPLRFATLAMLPDTSLPELNETLIRRLEGGEWIDGIILRYATGDIVRRAEAAYERRRQELSRQNLPQCLYPLVFYFLRHDPAYGERELRRIFTEPPAAPACHDLGHQTIEFGRYAMSPRLEKLAIEYLTSPSVLIKKGAAELLGHHGSIGARQPLWDAMEFFRKWWTGREAELNGQEGMQLERALRIALAQADGWVLAEADLQRLLGLCSSDWCRQEVNAWLQPARSPAQISAVPGMDGNSWSIAQYTVRSEQQLRRKLSQYPRGSAFRVASAGTAAQPAELQAALERAEAAVRAAGHTVAR